ncbi:hypothetical protein HK096_007664, partial [Nowakowskiella sp. JEL0078]
MLEASTISSNRKCSEIAQSSPIEDDPDSPLSEKTVFDQSETSFSGPNKSPSQEVLTRNSLEAALKCKTIKELEVWSNIPELFQHKYTEVLTNAILTHCWLATDPSLSEWVSILIDEIKVFHRSYKYKETETGELKRGVPITRGDLDFRGTWSTQEIIGVIRSTEAMKTWDYGFENSRHLEFLSPDDRVTISRMKAHKGIFLSFSGRDLLTVGSSQFTNGNQPRSFYTQTSIDVSNEQYQRLIEKDPKLDLKNNKRILAEARIIGWSVAKYSNEFVKLSLINHVNPKGFIPYLIQTVFSYWSRTGTLSKLKGIKSFLATQGTVPFIIRPLDTSAGLLGNSSKVTLKKENLDLKCKRYELEFRVSTTLSLATPQRLFSLALPAKMYPNGSRLIIRATQTTITTPNFGSASFSAAVADITQSEVPLSQHLAVITQIMTENHTKDLDHLISNHTGAVVRFSLAATLTEEIVTFRSRTMSERPELKGGMDVNIFITVIPNSARGEPDKVFRNGKPVAFAPEELRSFDFVRSTQRNEVDNNGAVEERRRAGSVPKEFKMEERRSDNTQQNEEKTSNETEYIPKILICV